MSNSENPRGWESLRESEDAGVRRPGRALRVLSGRGEQVV